MCYKKKLNCFEMKKKKQIFKTPLYNTNNFQIRIKNNNKQIMNCYRVQYHKYLILLLLPYIFVSILGALLFIVIIIT